MVRLKIYEHNYCCTVKPTQGRSVSIVVVYIPIKSNVGLRTSLVSGSSPTKASFPGPRPVHQTQKKIMIAERRKMLPSCPVLSPTRSPNGGPHYVSDDMEKIPTLKQLEDSGGTLETISSSEFNLSSSSRILSPRRNPIRRFHSNRSSDTVTPDSPQPRRIIRLTSPQRKRRNALLKKELLDPATMTER